MNPIELLADPVSLWMLAMYASLVGLEAARPARELTQSKGWHVRAMLSFVAFFFLSAYLPLLWDEQFEKLQIFRIGPGHPIAATVTGLFLYEGGLYLWHRAVHRFDLFFRIFHQMHHSAERLDTYGAFYLSPMDTVGYSALGSVSLVLLVGIPPKEAGYVFLAASFLSVFQHTNTRTPRWLGYLIQRPESHSVHHARGVHAQNYSDLPIFDILGGTFENPETFAEEAGFYDGASAKVGAMLCFQDVSMKPRGAEERSQSHLVGIEKKPNSTVIE